MCVQADKHQNFIIHIWAHIIIYRHLNILNVQMETSNGS